MLHSGTNGQYSQVGIPPNPFFSLGMINSFLPLSQPESLSQNFFQNPLLPSCISHFEAPGEDRQATPNRQIFRTGKGTVIIKTFLAKESQPRQVESERVEHAVDSHILPNQNEAALIADQRAGFKFNWEERGFKKFSVPTCHNGQEEGVVQVIWRGFCWTTASA
ncbi:hypothetical protein AVEN_185031-1 [Araneus ventricosus]|uniref:Uncharacterized protein n=1 Tax=Araneus ventricosus TaxID=182803 RepID=A0A4Y2BQU4_ARAVE|nr:hypothetical protein AVEN_185031-1 [Araneus ventricosus]